MWVAKDMRQSVSRNIWNNKSSFAPSRYLQSSYISHCFLFQFLFSKFNFYCNIIQFLGHCINILDVVYKESICFIEGLIYLEI